MSSISTNSGNHTDVRCRTGIHLSSYSAKRTHRIISPYSKKYICPCEFANYQDAEIIIANTFWDYNTARIHSALGHLAPESAKSWEMRNVRAAVCKIMQKGVLKTWSTPRQESRTYIDAFCGRVSQTVLARHYTGFA